MTPTERAIWEAIKAVLMAVLMGVIIYAVVSVCGCCLTGDGWHEEVYVPVMSGARWDGWKDRDDGEK